MTAPASLNRAGIAALIPHRGTMCVLDAMERWDERHIVCTASSHRDPANPMRSRRGLLAPCAIEYAAQAMALHGALAGAARAADAVDAAGATGAAQARAEGAAPSSRPGYLASARSVRFSRLRLDDLDGDLRIEARREAGDARQILYAFQVTHQGAVLAEGRATVVLEAGSSR